MDVRFIVMLIRSLWYLLDNSFEIEIEGGRLEERIGYEEQGIAWGYWFMESGSMTRQSSGV